MNLQVINLEETNKKNIYGTHDKSQAKKKYSVTIGLDTIDAVENLMNWASQYCEDNEGESISLNPLDANTTNAMNNLYVPVDEEGDEL